MNILNHYQVTVRALCEKVRMSCTDQAILACNMNVVCGVVYTCM